MTQHGSSFHLMLGLLADRAGFALDSVRLIPLQGVPNMIAAIKSGQADGTILPASIAYTLADAGDAKILGWVSERTPYQLGGLFTSTTNVEERRDVAERFVRAYQRGATDYHEAMNEIGPDGKRVFGPKAEELIPIIAKYTDATPDAIRAGAVYIDPLGRLDVGSVYEQVAWFKRQGLVDEGVDPDQFIDLSFIEGHFDIPAGRGAN
jgi:NitT/TauT family transport system substrate-binding protein